MLVFEPIMNELNNKITRTFLYKRIIENDKIQVLKCVDSIVQKDMCGSNNQNKYFNIHICHASKWLKDRIGGCLFPYEVLIWLTKRIVSPEFLITFSLEKNTWLLSEKEQHWSFHTIKDKLLKCNDFRFDTLYIYCHFDYEVFSKIWHRDSVKRDIKIITYEKFKDCMSRL